MALKLEALQVPLFEDAYGGIRVQGTRVLLEIVIGDFLRGARPEEIVDDFDTLDLADVYAVISYYLKNRDEVDAYLARRESEAAAIRAKIEAEHPPNGIRERLLARRAAMM